MEHVTLYNWPLKLLKMVSQLWQYLANHKRIIKHNLTDLPTDIFQIFESF